MLAPTGVACGSLEFPISAGTCNTFDLHLGLDGTVLQKLPAEFEATQGPSGIRNCTVRFWPAALR